MHTYLNFVSIVIGFSALSILLSALTLYVGALNGARILHQMLLYNILRVPCTTFFDVTPVGRILNRFSKDVDTLDNVLPMTLRGWITCFFSVCVFILLSSKQLYFWFNVSHSGQHFSLICGDSKLINLTRLILFV